MKKRTKKDFERYIKSVIKKWQPRLLLQRHKIDVRFSAKVGYLECGFHYPYLDTDVVYSNRAFEKWCEGSFNESSIVHELCHIITDPLYSKATSRYISKEDMEDERERLTDVISNITINLCR